MSPTPREGDSGLLTRLRSVPLSQVLALTIGFFLVRFIVRAIQRIYFHPLSKFPGPKLRAATRIPSHIETIVGSKHISLAALHRKYGHVVRVNHDELSFTHPDAWKDIYGHGTKGTKGSPPQKDWVRYGQSINGSVNLIQAREHDHNRQRKIFTPAFSDRALKQQEPLFLKYTEQLVSKLKESIEQSPDESIDMVRMYNFTTFDVMGDLTFGEPLHMLDNAEYDPWVSIIFSSIKIASRFSILVNYDLIWRPFRTIFIKGSNKQRLEHFGHSVTRVTKRLEKGRDTEGIDLWDLVLAQKEGKGLSRGEMDSNASLFMMAGTETTATFVSGMTYLLLKNPESMKKLVAEIRNAFTNADDMTMEQLAALPYFAACVKESFRLYPPVPLGLPRLTPDTGSTVCGQFIPPGTVCMIPQLAMYTHPDNFRNPEQYIPERWLGDARFEDDQRQALQPFSVGSRDCVGKNMAYHEMRLIMAKVLYEFDFELSEESKTWRDQATYILWEKKPLMCKLRMVN
ncbi:cytochrome P450 [Paraphoma chrysanthemicola]|uniref:Cytochrome P450 n=1 Tax=Paraphoma chrysanthemicola TaxID=798071 RepID=A0A8K0R7S6_9PLEO|nr:cytochrome P450 [Paraphoma chrysanthemicola]